MQEPTPVPARAGRRSGLERVHSVGGCLLRVVAAVLAGFFLILCVGVTVSGGPRPGGLAAIGVAVLGAAAALLPRWTERSIVVVGALSLAVTVLLAWTGAEVGNPSVVIEVSALLLLVVRVVWRSERRRAVQFVALGGAAVVAVPFRAAPVAALLLSAPLALLVAVAIGVGLYLRAIDARRVRAVHDARRDERLELARDLHDFVAHHVTGIVVQAQAARFAAGAAQDPERLDRMFGGIEEAGAEALESMRRVVGLLREAESGGRGRRPVDDLARLGELVARFTDPPAVLTVDPGLGAPAPEVATSIHRVVQEALTNARKHAADASSVRVDVYRTGDAVEVAVRDDGRGRGRLLPSGGYGLAGLAERVEAVGGRLRAGPRPDGGWEVIATLPARHS